MKYTDAEIMNRRRRMRRAERATALYEAARNSRRRSYWRNVAIRIDAQLLGSDAAKLIHG